jgi:hypothetical protein
MTTTDVNKVKKAIDNCKLKYSIRGSNWVIIEIPFGIHECVFLLIPIDIKSYRIHILFEESCINIFDTYTNINKAPKTSIAATYKAVNIISSSIVPSQKQIELDIKAAYQACISYGLV